MHRPRPLPVAVFAAWTLLVWVQRVVNIVGLGGGGALDLVRAVVFVLVGAAVAFVALTDVPPLAARRIVLGSAAVTAALWAVQMIAIPLRHHGAAFVVVHLMLGAISIALAGWAVTAIRGSAELPREV